MLLGSRSAHRATPFLLRHEGRPAAYEVVLEGWNEEAHRSAPLCVRSRGASADDVVVLHRPERGGGSGRDADLGVDVLDVVVGGLGRDDEPVGDLARREARARRGCSTSTSRRDSPPGFWAACRARAPGSPWPAATSTARVARGSSTPSDSSRRSSAAASSSENARPVGALGGQPDVDLGRGQHARCRIAGVGAEALVVAGAVALLVVRRGDRVQGGEGRRAAEHLLGEHRVELDAVELRPRERAGLVPDRVRHRGRAEVVHERRPAERGRVLLGQARARGRRRWRAARSGGCARPCTATSGR